MNVYILRHGTTVWNETGRTQGRRQNKLSENGKIVAQKAAEELKNLPFDVIYGSPLMRTMQTANIVNKFHGVKIERCELLTEVDQGVFSGRLYRTLTDEEKQLKRQRDPSTKMEQLDHALARAKEFYETVIKNNPNKNILIVSHNNICSFLKLILNGEQINLNDHDQINCFANAEFKKFEI